MNASRRRFAAAALEMSNGNTKHVRRRFAFPLLIASAQSAGDAGRCDALTLVGALRISVTL
jgi:hypothetical protein